jgi:hypothetical protein
LCELYAVSAFRRTTTVRLKPDTTYFWKRSNPMSLKEWAAAAYPIVRAHLDAAKVLKIAADKRPRTTN